jgi:hypothetical protein
VSVSKFAKVLLLLFSLVVFVGTNVLQFFSAHHHPVEDPLVTNTRLFFASAHNYNHDHQHEHLMTEHAQCSDHGHSHDSQHDHELPLCPDHTSDCVTHFHTISFCVEQGVVTSFSIKSQLQLLVVESNPLPDNPFFQLDQPPKINQTAA